MKLAVGSRTWLLAAVAGAVFTGSAGAQSGEALRVRLQDEVGAPVAGALVSLLSSDSVSVAEGLTSIDGRRTLRAPPGAYRLHVRRIGFRPFISTQLTVPHDGELTIVVDAQRVVLNTVVVTASTACRLSGADAERVATVWDEVAKALRASQLSNADLAGIGRAWTYRKELSTGGFVLASDTSTFVVRNVRPFGAADPRILARQGYISGDYRRGWEFFGLDETVLLSEEFSATHCFRLTREGARPGEIGLAFEPVRGRRLPDVRGVLWLDEESAELKELRYQFVVEGLLARAGAEGATRFRRMPSGAWLVDEWRLRLPRIVLAPGQREHVWVAGYIETGGGIEHATARAPVVQVRAGVWTVSGVVFDSLRFAPLPNAVVTIGQTVARTGQDGRFTFRSVPAGDHVVSFSHASFSTLGFIALEREITVAGADQELMLATPSLETMWQRVCHDAAPSEGGRRALLHGTVTDKAGEAVRESTVRVTWTDSEIHQGGERLSLDVRTNDEGRYAACGFGSAVRGQVRAALGARQSAGRDFDFGVTPVVRRDLTLTAVASDASESKRELIVTVVDPDGRALADALVFIEGSSEVTRTDDAGRASLPLSVDSQEVTLIARRLGFAETVLRVRPGPARRQQVRVRLSSVQALEEVVVRGAAPLPAPLERRRRLSTGFIYGPEELEAAGGVHGVLRRTPGASIEGTGRWAVRFRHPAQGGDCWADVYIDGQLSAPSESSFGDWERGFKKFDELASLGSQAIYAVEVYPRVTQAPLDVVRLRDGCGAILVWTVVHAERELERANRARAMADSSERDP